MEGGREVGREGERERGRERERDSGVDRRGEAGRERDRKTKAHLLRLFSGCLKALLRLLRLW
jgi:hypothetical protein